MSGRNRARSRPRWLRYCGVRRWGRDIVLYEDTWYDKVLASHIEMSDMIDAVVQTLTDPDRVAFDASFAGGENYYRRWVLPHPYDVDFLKVVVRFEDINGEMAGVVVTAFSAPNSKKRGERFKWNR